MPSDVVPTVNDLRVKLCYICREEELYGAPSDNPPRAWTHPCKCTLIAHEQCLLKWIQTSQANESRAPNALKCPQCGSAYELESNNPIILRALEWGNKVLQRTGSIFMVFGAATVCGVIATSFYVVCTAYGAWAVRKFIGDEMFDVLLGDNPSEWPWSAYLNLPVLPFSLIMTRFQATSHVSPAIPIILAWPEPFNLTSKARAYWNIPENARNLVGLPPPQPRTWPPSPVLFGLFGVPIVRMVYRSLYSQLYFKVMGSHPPVRTIRRQQRRQQQHNANGNGNAGRRENAAVMNIGGGGGQFMIQLRANVREEVIDPNNPNNNNNNANNAARPEDGGNGNDDPNVAEVAEQLIEINASSLGRKVAGALLIPAISSWMGNILLRLSRHSFVLREFLAVKQPIGKVWIPPPLTPINSEAWNSMSVLKQISVGTQTILKAVWGSTKTFSESDPVWWRNTVGLGLFIVAKDCLQLLHLWLAKRELESRKVKSRDFSGVDIRELDLIPDFLRMR